MSVIQKPKGRMRSASSPAKAFIFAPAADSLPTLTPDTPKVADADGSVEMFAKGIDRLNGEYRNALLSEFDAIRKQIIAHQKLVNSSELKLMTDKVHQNQLELTRTLNDLNNLKKEYGKRLTILEASWTYFEKKRFREERALLFAKWKSKYFTVKREKLVCHMAIIHNHASIMRKIMNGWRGVVGSTWKSNFEKKLKSEADICIQEMSQKYEEQISMLNDQLTQANLRLKAAESKTDLKEAEMKRALMRGVCALNMEAMSVFRDKTILTDPSKCSVSKQVLQNISDPGFEAVIIPKNEGHKLMQYSENLPKNQDSKMTRILVTRHQ